MARVVVGVFPNHAALTKLTETLRSSGLDSQRLQVVSPETPSTDLIETGVQFAYAGDDDSVISSGGGIMTSFGGTSVPGLSASSRRIGISGDDTVERLLGDLEVPESKSDGYANAIEQGKTIAGYPSGSDAEKIKGLFSAAGADQVEVFND